MKLRIRLLLIFCLCILSVQSEAQFLKKLGEKVSKQMEQKMEKRTEREVDKKTDAALDSLLAPKNKGNRSNQGYSEDDRNRANSMLEAMMNGADVETESSYTFPVIATIEVEDYGRRKSDITKMKQGFGDGALYMEMEESPENQIITDMKNEAMIMVDTKKGTASVMSLAWMKKMGTYKGGDYESDSESSDFDIRKTGNRKTISGYECEEYIFTSEDNKMHVWFAPDVPFDYKDYIEGFTSMFNKKEKNNPMLQLKETYGYMMEMVSYDKKGEKESRMTVTDISKDEKTIDMSTLKVQGMMDGAGN